MIKYCFLIALLLKFITGISQVNSRVINTAMPFLEVPTSVRSLGMGNVGAGTAPDDNVFYDPAKIAFTKYTHMCSLSYLPWMRSITPDMSLSNLNYIHNGGDNNAWAANFTYFNLGTVNSRNENGAELGIFKANECSLSGSYAKAITYSSSLAVTVRGIYSHLANLSGTPGLPYQDVRPVFTAAVDISYYKVFELSYTKKIMFGANLSNIGPKISYDNIDTTKTSLPINFRIGVGYNNEVDEDNGFTLGLDINKLLVPTPPEYDNAGNIVRGKNPNKGVLSGMMASFVDAPGGVSEELKEVYLCLGGEYRFKDVLSLRAGLSYEDPSKGDRKYLSFGAGYKGMLYEQQYAINICYLLPFSTSTIVSPFKNCYGLTVTYFLGDSKN